MLSNLVAVVVLVVKVENSLKNNKETQKYHDWKFSKLIYVIRTRKSYFAFKRLLLLILKMVVSSDLFKWMWTKSKNKNKKSKNTLETRRITIITITVRNIVTRNNERKFAQKNIYVIYIHYRHNVSFNDVLLCFRQFSS